MIKIKKVYEAQKITDGHRVFVDRLWPRGLKKEDLKFDEWPKEICPSSDLRKWFAHDPERFKEFRSKYKQELKDPQALDKLNELTEIAGRKNVTLLYAAHDEKINHAIILKQVLESRLKRRHRPPAHKISPIHELRTPGTR